jgi:hypothetical protein
MLIPFLRYIYIILQRKKLIKKSQNSRNQKVYLVFLLVDGMIRIRICTNKVRIRMQIQEIQKHTDPDPDHCA